MLKSIVCILTFSLVSLMAVQSQEKGKYLFHTFSPEGGFDYDGVSHIKQDKEGFIWILMAQHLYCFNGYEYKHYYHHFKQETDQDDKFFNSICVDNTGQIYVAMSDGLYRYIKASDSFEKLYHANINFLETDQHNTIWLCKSGQFGSFNSLTKSFKNLLFNKRPLTHVNELIKEDNGLFILNWGRNIFRYSNDSQEVSLLYAFENDQYIKAFCKIDNTLWLLSRDNLFYKLDIPSGTITDTIRILPKNKQMFYKKILVDKHQNIWITSQKGLYIYNTTTSSIQHYKHSQTDPRSLPNNSVWTIEEDLQRNIWIGTYSGGLCYTNLDREIHFTSRNTLTSPIKHNIVSGFAENENHIWIATEGGGFTQVNKHNGQDTSFLNNAHSNSLSSNNVKSIIVDPEHNLWLATFRGGLVHYNTNKNAFNNHKWEKGNKASASILSNNLRKLLPVKDGFWILYQMNKLSISFYSYHTKTFRHYHLDTEANNQYIFDICRDNTGLLWLVTNKFLYSMNSANGSFRKIKLNTATLLNGRTIIADGENNLWIGTEGKGLIKYNSATKSLMVYDDILKFNVSSIYSINLDNTNNLWLGTNNGLFRYNPPKKEFLRFDRKDGVQGKVFYPLSTYKDKTGHIYFGGTNGYTLVTPNKITKNYQLPEARISEFFINNSSALPIQNNLAPESSLHTFPKQITLDHSQSNFGFSITSDNYLLPNKCRFRYRLKNYDNRWIEVDAYNRRVLYSKVPPGDYIFEVLASNNDGVWSTKPFQVHIKRTPAPWLSWWALSAYILLILAVTYRFLRYYWKQVQIKKQLYFDHLQQEKKEEIHQYQLQFFTNISHDFRTPLSLINASVEKLKDAGLNEYYYRILGSNTKRLLRLVNELMDFRTLENNKLKLQVAPTDVNSIVENYAFDFKDYAVQRNINFSIHLDEKLPNQLFIDQNLIEKLIMNLLNNAFKHTPNEGNISIRTLAPHCSFTSDYEHSFKLTNEQTGPSNFSIVVSDTGSGIAKDSLEHIFDRFYKADSNTFDSSIGTGIGLALVKSFVLLHHGELTVYSQLGKGSDFVLSLPADAAGYQPTEFLITHYANNNPGCQLPLDLTAPINKNTHLPEDNYTKDQRRILIVEDHVDLRLMLVDLLAADFEVIEAENGLIASQLIEKMRIDLVVSDIMMPEKDGISLCQEVKGNIQYSHIPFILLSAKVEVESKLEGAYAGADIYFEKPVDFNLLALTIRNVFKQQQQLRTHYSRNFFADSTELTSSQRDQDFMQAFIDVIDKTLNQPEMDVNSIALQLSMSRSKLYNKIKGITGHSIIEFIKNYRLRKAAHLIIEKDLTMREITLLVGFESQSYFSRAFKKEFGHTPTEFAAKHKNTPISKQDAAHQMKS